MAPTNRQSVAFRRLIVTEFKSGLSRDEVAHKYHITFDSVDVALRYFLNRWQKVAEDSRAFRVGDTTQGVNHASL